MNLEQHERWSPPWVASQAGMIAGLAITAASMSSGFIWATQGEIVLVYVAGFFAWTGYMVGHYFAEGVFVDDIAHEDTAPDTADSDGDDNQSHLSAALDHLRHVAPDDPVRAVGFVAGIAILVAGIAILAWYVRQENHLLGNVGSGMFLGGYVIAHYFDAGKPL